MSTKKKLASLTLQKNESTNTKQCRLRFSMCDSKHPMWDLDSEEIKEFIKFAKKVEQLEWKDIRKDKGLRYETLNNYKGPESISKDVSICSMRLSRKSRIIGYRQEEYFYIIWFDNNHETC